MTGPVAPLKLIVIAAFLVVGCTQTAELSDEVPVIPEGSTGSADSAEDPEPQVASRAEDEAVPDPAASAATAPPIESATTTPAPTALATEAGAPVVAPEPACSDATEIRQGWVDSANEQIARQGARFPEELWICDNDPSALVELECLPLRTERMFTMLIDIFGDEARALADAGAVFCTTLSPDS